MDNEENCCNDIIPKKNSEIIESPQIQIENEKLSLNDSSQKINEKGTSVVELGAIKVATEDDKFIQQIADVKKEQIQNSVNANAEILKTKKEAEKIDALTEQDKAIYQRWKSVLMFGGIKESHTKLFLRLMIILILPIYVITTLLIKVPFSIVNTLLGVINDTINKIADFGKAAKRIAISILVILLVVVIGYVIYFFLNKYGIINKEQIDSIATLYKLY